MPRVTTSLALVLSLAPALLAAGRPANLPGQAATALPDVLKKSIAYYSTLTSYADTGTVQVDTGGTIDESRFTTYFRRPTRDFYFDFEPLTSVTQSTRFSIDMRVYRTVIWMFKGNMQTYEFRSNNHQEIDAEGGGQVRALQSANHVSQGVSILIPSLLYSQARLASTILQIEQADLAGSEDIQGHRCDKVVGVAAAYYPSGQRTSVRPVTVWVDAESRLIRRVLEDTPRSYPAGGVLRLTMTFQPQANPTIDDAKFQFKVPQ